MTESSKGTVWTLVVIGFVVLLFWKLWPVLSSMNLGQGSSQQSSNDSYPSSYNGADWYAQGQQDLQDQQDAQQILQDEAFQQYASPGISWVSSNPWIPSGGVSYSGGSSPNVTLGW